mgnify:CR=1 FL=1
MSKFNKLYEQKLEQYQLNEKEWTPEEWGAAIEKEYKKHFPKGKFSAKDHKGLGRYLSVSFGIQDPKKWANDIAGNDPALHSILLDLNDDGTFPTKITADMGQGGSMAIKSTNPHMAYGRVKFGWRKKTGTPDQLLKHMTNYFAKMKKVVDANQDNLAHDLT